MVVLAGEGLPGPTSAADRRPGADNRPRDWRRFRPKNSGHGADLPAMRPYQSEFNSRRTACSRFVQKSIASVSYAGIRGRRLSPLIGDILSGNELLAELVANIIVVSALVRRGVHTQCMDGGKWHTSGPLRPQFRRLSPHRETSDGKMVSRKSIYYPLHQKLLRESGDCVRFTFEEIESVLQRPLPASAYKFTAWWNKTSRGGAAKAWVAAGFTARDSMKHRVVEFHRKILEVCTEHRD